MLLHEAPRQLRDVIMDNGLTTLRANWNTWWDQEKARRRASPGDPSKVLQNYWKDNYDI